MENLKKLRTSRGLSQQALAEKFNLTQQAIYKYENGLAEPDIEMLRNLAVFFGVSVDYLIGNSQSSNAEALFVTLSPTEQELEILRIYRFLSPELQNSIELIIKNMQP